MNKKNKSWDSKENDLNTPDPETLHTTDPQEHMEVPVSSLVQDALKPEDRNNQGDKKHKGKKK